MFGSTDVGRVRIGAGAGHVTQLTAKLILSITSQNSAAAPAAAAALGNLQRRLLLLVLLAFEMLLVSLKGKPLTYYNEIMKIKAWHWLLTGAAQQVTG